MHLQILSSVFLIEVFDLQAKSWNSEKSIWGSHGPPRRPRIATGWSHNAFS